MLSELDSRRNRLSFLQQLKSQDYRTVIVSLKIKSLLRSIENSRFMPRSRNVARLLTQKIVKKRGFETPHCIFGIFRKFNLV